MVVLQKDPAAMMLASRVVARPKLEFDSTRPLGFEIRSIMKMANRPYTFEAFRMLHYDIVIEDAVSSREKAKELNIIGVKLYKEGKLDEALWNFQKALSIDSSYENARKNMETINAKVEARKVRMTKEAKAGKSFSQVSRDIKREADESRAKEARADYPEQPIPQTQQQQTYQQQTYQQQAYQQQAYQQQAYQQQAYQQQAYQQQAYQQQAYQQPSYQQQGYQTQNQSGSQNWQRNYRCPGCGIPVKTDWVMCTNCGTDLRRYPPIPY